MSEEAWDRFVEHSREVLSRPRFDEGERNWKFTIAGQIRELLGAGHRPQELSARLDAVFPRPTNLRDHRVDLPEPQNINWLRRWATLDAPSLTAALAVFAKENGDAVQRFAEFERRALDTPDDVRVWSGGILSVGSWLNFALAPERLPVMRMALFVRLEQLLSYGAVPPVPLADAYARHVGFAEQVGRRLAEAGVEVRDMVDVQSVIFIAAKEWQYWAVDEPEEVRLTRERAAVARKGKPYLSVCAMYRNEGRYLREWIEFHRLVGVERFFLYDNNSTDDHLTVLSPYIEDGIVVLHDWPISPGQMQANDQCMREYRHESRWIATLDIDEFLFSPTGRAVSDVLVEYEEHPGVAVNWVAFGTDGHRSRPEGLVIESYLRRGRRPWPWVKNVVDPARVVRCKQAHAFEYDFRLAVDENQVPVPHGAGRTQFASVSRLRINHYYLRSEEEGRQKLSVPFEGVPRPFEFEALDRMLNEERDEAILRYLPDLRDSLSRTASVGGT